MSGRRDDDDQRTRKQGQGRDRPSRGAAGSGRGAADQPGSGAAVVGPDLSPERPLDALLPGLAASRTLPRSPFHQRVLEVELENGYEWVFACWQSPREATAFHRELKQLVEATLLAELSRPPSQLTEPRTFRWLRLVLFDEPPAGVETAVRAFGFRPRPYRAEHFLNRVGVLRDEAERLGWRVPEHPVQMWVAPVAHPGGETGEALADIDRMMADRMGADVWGGTPGGPSKLFAILAEPRLETRFGPDLDGLQAFETFTIQSQVGPIRWIPPLVFQALCDFIGVVLGLHFGMAVEWAVSEPGPGGLAPPPLLRLRRRGRVTHLAIGLHLLRWCVMPIQPDEAIPSLAEWLESEFA